jgi:hypothetical protein
METKELLVEITSLVLFILLCILSTPFLAIGFLYSFGMQGVDDGIELHKKLMDYLSGS